MFLQYGLVLAGIGVVCGLSASVEMTKLIASMLFGVTALDPATYAIVPVILGTAAGLASYIPARRAARVDPNEALRME